MNSVHNSLFHDVSPISSPTLNGAERLNTFMIQAPAKEDLPESMKAVLSSIIEKGPIPNVPEQSPESNRGVDASQPGAIYSRIVVPRARPKAKGCLRRMSTKRSSRRHARFFNGEEMYSWRYREKNFKGWLARNLLCIR